MRHLKTFIYLNFRVFNEPQQPWINTWITVWAAAVSCCVHWVSVKLQVSHLWVQLWGNSPAAGSASSWGNTSFLLLLISLYESTWTRLILETFHFPSLLSPSVSHFHIGWFLSESLLLSVNIHEEKAESVQASLSQDFNVCAQSLFNELHLFPGIISRRSWKDPCYTTWPL